LLKFFRQFLEVFCGKIRIALIALLLFDRIHDIIELGADLLSLLGLDAFGLFHDHVGKHLDQPAVGIPYKPLVSGLFNQAGNGPGGQPDV
jgi:hypothetical protein